VLAIIALVLLSACSAEPTPTPVPATPTPTVIPTPGPPPAGTLRVAVIGAAPHQDLHRLVSEWATLFGSANGYSRLFRFVAGPSVETPSLRVECDLCRSWRFVDATTLEVELHPDAWWQDAEDFASRPVAALDVLWSLERLRELGSPHERLLDSVDVIEVIGETGVRFKLHHPDADFLLKLASPYAAIMTPASLDGVNLRTGRVLGAGPWRYVRGGTGQVTLTAWEDYFRDGEPAAESVVFLPVADLGTGALLMDLDRVDMAQVTEEQWAAMDQGRFDSVVIDRQGRGVLFGLNSSREPLDDLAYRRALFGALDPQAAIAGSFGIGWAGLGMPLVEPTWALPGEPLATHADAPPVIVDEPRTLKLTIGNFGEAYVAHGEALAAQLRTAGFEIVSEVLSRGAYLDAVWQRQDYDLFVGPMPPTDTPSAYMLAMLHSRGASNITGAGSDELDALIEAFSITLNPAERGDIAQRMQALALDGAWQFMAAGLSERWAFNDRVLDPPRAFPQGSGDWWKHIGVQEPL
jgi:ABC-type transport system substrate-binding protein